MIGKGDAVGLIYCGGGRAGDLCRFLNSISVASACRNIEQDVISASEHIHLWRIFYFGQQKRQLSVMVNCTLTCTFSAVSAHSSILAQSTWLRANVLLINFWYLISNRLTRLLYRPVPGLVH